MFPMSWPGGFSANAPGWVSPQPAATTSSRVNSEDSLRVSIVESLHRGPEPAANPELVKRLDQSDRWRKPRTTPILRPHDEALHPVRGHVCRRVLLPWLRVKQPLLDMSSEEAQALLSHPDMRRAVQSHYVERSGMVRTALGSLVGVLGGLFILRYAVGAESLMGRVAWIAASLGWMIFFAGGAITSARRRARRANEGTDQYICVDEDEPVEKFRPPPRRGLRWTTW